MSSEEISIHTIFGTLFLRKSSNKNKYKNNCSEFGETVCVILPIHGDYNCQCKQCFISKLSNEYKNKGYDIVKFIDKI